MKQDDIFMLLEENEVGRRRIMGSFRRQQQMYLPILHVATFRKRCVTEKERTIGKDLSSIPFHSLPTLPDLFPSTNSLPKVCKHAPFPSLHVPFSTTASNMKKEAAVWDSVSFSGKLPSHFAAECLIDDACILEMDYFVRTLEGIKQKGVRPDLIGSIITHYASKWLPELSADDDPLTTFEEESPASVTASWMKKRFFVETLVGILPPEKDVVPCNFLLRLLCTGNMVGVEPSYRAEIEKRISWQLEQASLKELMIPSFSHTCGTLLDVELVIRLVKRFVSLDEGVRSGASFIKVAKLVDCYLAEAAMDSNLGVSEFVALAGALTTTARSSDDVLYRAIDTYLKAHPTVSKQERKIICRLMDSRKLSPEASLHAAQNERLPVRAVIQVLFSNRTKLNCQIDWSGSFGCTRSPSHMFDVSPAMCHSKLEMATQTMEMKRLKEDVVKLQNQCSSMQMQMEWLMEKKTKQIGFFKWKKIGMPSLSKSRSVVEKVEEGEVEGGFGRQGSLNTKTKMVRGRTPSN